MQCRCLHTGPPPGRVVGVLVGGGWACQWAEWEAMHSLTLVCIHSAGGWSLLLTASRTVPPSLNSWGAEHKENPPTVSTPGSDTSSHCPALKETAGLETFNSNPFTVGESWFTPTTVAGDATYERKANIHLGRAEHWLQIRRTASLKKVKATRLRSLRARRPQDMAAASRPSRHTRASSQQQQPAASHRPL